MVRQRLGWWIVVALLAAGCAAPRSLGPAATDQTDVWFMQHMVPYLRQTTVVVSLTKGRLTDPGLARMADTVTRRSLADIDQLQRWLDQRGLSPHGHSHQRTDSPRQTDLERLAMLRGTALDLAFVQVMTARSRTTRELAATEAHDGTLPEVRRLAHQMMLEHQARIAKMAAWKRLRPTRGQGRPRGPGTGASARSGPTRGASDCDRPGSAASSRCG
jgi:uncharacterized protein (DUF305 family)